MSNMATIYAWEKKGITPTEKLILLFLADTANCQSYSYVDFLAIKKGTGLVRERAEGHIASLVSKGALSCSRIANNKRMCKFLELDKIMGTFNA